MSRGTKSEFYRYSMRSTAYTNLQMCTDKIYAYQVPSKNAESIERLFCHFKIQFDAAVASASRKIEQIGIASERPSFIADSPATLRVLNVDLTADGNREIDLKIDLSSLLTKGNIEYTPEFGADYEQDNMTFVYVKLPIELRDTLNVGTIELWKIDAEYTTREIR